MKIQISKSLLAGTVSAVSKMAAGEKSTLAVLQTLLLATEGNSIKIAATNLEQGAVVTVPADVSSQGACCVDAKDFGDWANAVDGDITLELKETKLHAKASGNTTKFVVVNADEFPPTPLSEGEPFLTLPAGQWKKICGLSSFASKDDARPVLQGVSLSLNGSFKAAATDGFRLMILEIQDAKTPTPISAIVPASAFKRLGELLPKTLDTLVSFWLCRDRAIWKFGNITLFSSTINGNYPPVETIIPKTTKVLVKVSTPSLVKALKPVGVVARDSNNLLRVEMVQGEIAQLHLSSVSESTGSGESDCQIDSYTPGWETTHYNLLFLSEMLNQFPGKATFGWNKNNSPLKITSEEDPGLIGVIMPVNPGTEQANKQNEAAEKSAAASA